MAQARGETREKAAYLFVQIQKIVDRFEKWDASHYDLLGISPDSPLRSQPNPVALVLEGNPPSDGILGYWEGEFAVVFQDELKKLKDVPLSVAIPWVGYHEQGHMIDQRRYRAEGANDAPIPDNIELNSMLFPVIFSPPHIYLDDFARRMANGVNSDNVYCQAIKGILNGLWKRALELRLIKDDVEMVQEGEWLTDSFEPVVVNRMINVLKTVPEKKIQDMAAYIYQRRSTYLNTAKPGVQKVIMADGGEGWMKEFMAGVDKGYKTKVVGKIDGKKMVIDSQTKKDRPKFKPGKSQKGDGKGGGGKGKGKPSPGQGKGGKPDPNNPGKEKSEGEKTSEGESDLLDIPAVSAGALQKFMTLFAGAPNEIRFLSAEGEEISLEEFASSRGVSDFFVQVQQLKARTRGHFAVTMDVSGSTAGDVNRMFVEMARQFVALFHRAAARNPDVQAGVAVHGDDYVPMLNPRQSHKAPRVRQALGELSAYPAGEGNNFQLVIEKIIAKHKKRTGLPILEIVITDGQVSVSEETLWEAHQKGIDIVIVGYGTPSVLQFHKAINVPADTDSKGLLSVLLKVAELKAKRKDGKLPFDKNLGQRIGLSNQDYSEDTNAIDASNSFLAFFAAVAVFALVSVIIGPAYSFSHARIVETLILSVGGLFLGVFALALLFRVLRVAIDGDTFHLNSFVPLWGTMAEASVEASFVQYNHDKKIFEINPILYRLLSGHFVVAFLTHFVLAVFLVPLHEKLHARGWKSEGLVYLVQGSVFALLVGLLVLLPGSWEPIYAAIVFSVVAGTAYREASLARNKDTLKKYVSYLIKNRASNQSVVENNAKFISNILLSLSKDRFDNTDKQFLLDMFDELLAEFDKDSGGVERNFVELLSYVTARLPKTEGSSVLFPVYEKLTSLSA